MAIFKGAGVALITPMKEDGSVNFEKVEELVEFHIANGTDAIIACGTTGESATLPIEEHLEVIRTCIEVSKKRVPIIAGAGSNSTASAIYTSTQSEKMGADGLLLVTPYYNKATQNGLVAHFTTIANSVKIPALLYNVGSRTGINMEAATTARLVKEVDNIVGIKEASGNLSQVAEIMSLMDGKIDLYSGNDDQIVPTMALGGIGIISVLSNIAPKQTHDIAAKYLEGDIEGSRKLQLTYFPLIKALFSEVNPIPIKKAMQLMGMDSGVLRLPLTEMEPAHAEALAEELKKVGLLK
jgi:4-hydroxy-tetrahydrodipicolinate synthase